MHWFIEPIKNQYADFSGRTGREAYWMFVLFAFLLQIAITIVGGLVGVELLAFVFALLTIVPSIAICARRLHDIGKSGWWQLIAIIPLVGIIVLIVWLASKADAEGNKYGEGTVAPGVSSAETNPVTQSTVPPVSENTQTEVGK